MTSISEIEGIGPALQKKFAAAKIKTVEALLIKGGKSAQRKEIAKETGISLDKVLTFVNHADLFRIKGVGSEYSELLEASGVDTVVELSKRNVENLAEKMAEVNKKKKLVRVVPSASMVKRWVAHAKKLPRAVHH